MKKLIILASALLILPFGSGFAAGGTVSRKKPKIKTTKLESEKDLGKNQTDIVQPLETPLDTPVHEGVVDKIFRHIVIPLGSGPLLLLPIVDSSKDLGPNYGIMPIWALRDKKRDVIGSVIAPSINYNQYLRTTYTYRHYVFPDDKQLWLLRASYSTVVQRELFLRYYNPEVMGTRFRVNAEARHWINGKASFYGIGQDTKRDGQSTFALDMTGEEFTVNFPLPHGMYADFTHAYYRYKVERGPVVTIPQLEDKYPDQFAATDKSKDFLTQRFAIFYDDTDHPIVPKIGTYAGLSAKFARHGFGSDYSYNTYTAEVKHYYNYKEEGKYVTALHALFEDKKGDNIPFYAMPTLGESTGLRSVGDGRFIDGGKLVFNLEERITVSRLPVLKFLSEIELTPFVDAGTVFGTVDEIMAKKLQFGYGGAFRIVLRPQVVATADFAYGKEGPNIIIHVGYPF